MIKKINEVFEDVLLVFGTISGVILGGYALIFLAIIIKIILIGSGLN